MQQVGANYIKFAYGSLNDFMATVKKGSGKKPVFITHTIKMGQPPQQPGIPPQPEMSQSPSFSFIIATFCEGVIVHEWLHATPFVFADERDKRDKVESLVGEFKLMAEFMRKKGLSVREGYVGSDVAVTGFVDVAELELQIKGHRKELKSPYDAMSMAVPGSPPPEKAVPEPPKEEKKQSGLKL